MMKILWAIDAKAQAWTKDWWEPKVLRRLDRYAHRGRHHAGRPGPWFTEQQREARALSLEVRRQLNDWYRVFNYDGIQAAIALGY